MSTAIVDGNAVPDETQPSLCSRRHVDGKVLFRRHVDGRGVKMTPGKGSFVLVKLRINSKWRKNYGSNISGFKTLPL